MHTFKRLCTFPYLSLSLSLYVCTVETLLWSLYSAWLAVENCWWLKKKNLHIVLLLFFTTTHNLKTSVCIVRPPPSPLSYNSSFLLPPLIIKLAFMTIQPKAVREVLRSMFLDIIVFIRLRNWVKNVCTHELLSPLFVGITCKKIILGIVPALEMHTLDNFKCNLHRKYCLFAKLNFSLIFFSSYFDNKKNKNKEGA